MSERFELLEQLGRGGMGTVWKARDAETGEFVALKLLHQMYVDDPDYVARFEREVEIAQRINSPHVVKVLGYGKREGVPYVAMEYVAGKSLRELLKESGPVDWNEARRIGTQMAIALAAAEAAGVIHRDVKPSNVLIDTDGNVKLVDFGIARASDLTSMTGSVTILGTPAYMSPDRTATAQSDLYALGCVLFELLCGAPPFEGDSQQHVLMMHIQDQPDLGRLPSVARPVVGWLLEKDPKLRPAGASMLLAVLRGTSSTPQRLTAKPRRTLVGVSLGLFGLFGFVALAAAIFFGRGDSDPQSAATATATASNPSVVVSPTAPPTTPPTAPPTAPPTTPNPGGALSTANPGESATPTSTVAGTEPPTSPTPTVAEVQSPTPTQTPVVVAGSTLVFQPNTSAYPVPGELEICWKGTPIGSRFFVTIRMTSPRDVEWSSEYVASEFTTCRFVETAAGDGPTVSFDAIARGDDGAILAQMSYTMSTYPLPTAKAPPEIVGFDGPATARLDEPTVFKVDWKDPDGNSLSVVLTIEGAVHEGTEDPYVNKYDVGNVSRSEQIGGSRSAFGVICRDVDPEPRRLLITITDSAGLTDTYESTFACLE